MLRRALLAIAVALPVVLGATAMPALAAGACTRTVGPGDRLARTVARAPSGADICLRAGAYSTLRLTGAAHRPAVTVRPAAGVARADVRVGGVRLQRVSGLTIEGLRLTGRVAVVQSGSRIRVVGNEIAGIRGGGRATAGVYLYGWVHPPRGTVTDILIQGNDIHGMDWPAGRAGGPADGYGVVMAGNHARITVRGNTIRDVAVDSIQSSGGDDLVVDGNLFEGPGHSGAHPGVHVDLWQIFGDAHHVRFTDNVIRGTATDESLLFQSGRLRDVVVQNNLFDHDSTGYSAQLYPAHGLVLRGNTFIGSRWGVVLRGAAPGTYAGGRDYVVERNTVFAAEGAGIGLAPSVLRWGTFDWNASTGISAATGPNGLSAWASLDGDPASLPFQAGYVAPPAGR